MTGPLGDLLTVAVAGFFVGAGVSFFGRRAGYAIALVASILFGGVGAAAMFSGHVAGPQWTGPIGNPESLGLDALSGFFAVTAGIVWVATSAYSLSYDRRPSPVLAAAYGATLGSIAVLLSSGDFVLFLIGWEGMTIAAYAMILQATGRAGRVVSASFVFLAFGEASTLLVLVAVAGLRVASGSFLESPTVAGALLANVVFVSALLGFGLKMGVAPFHMSEWLPIAHSSAPSNASAVLSSTLTLAGVYGLFRVLSLLPSPPAWWGAVMLSIGAISALLGALFAAVSEHSKGLPAYSTIENNGLILVALGIALVARSEGLSTLYAFALYAAFFQAIAHALAKTALFLSAGYVERSTGTFDLTTVEGRAKRSGRAAFFGTLVAALSLAAAPPLAGFVSEWMILEALLQSYRFSPFGLEFVGLLAGAAVALAAGLIVAAMVKFLGFTFLWRPRPTADGARADGLGTVVGAVGVVVVGLGVLAPWVLRAVAPAAIAFAGTGVPPPVGSLLAVPPGWSILSGAPFGILSPPMIPFGLAAGAAVGVGYFALRRMRSVRHVDPWMAGSAPGVAGETYTSFGYSTGLRIMLGSMLDTREVRSDAGLSAEVGLATPESYNVELEVLDRFKGFYDGLVRFGVDVSDLLKRSVMPGDLGRYLAYVLIVTLAAVIFAAVVA
ncbi:MAG TPA: proton-conducting transporter membrane subunit [Thermoplasmata archaeon]|nr:proton-conducting transporter membrane subunit [Thermoplasmata archaeon]